MTQLSLQKFRIGSNCRLFEKIFCFELKFLFWKMRFLRLLIIFIPFTQLLITGYSDIKSSLFGQDGLLPGNWNIFKGHEKAVIILILILLFMISWLIDTYQRSQETSRLSLAVKEHVIPNVNNELGIFMGILKKRYGLSKGVRLSIFIPLRERFLVWKLHMICKTRNIDNRELNASLNLNEGVIGYTFMQEKEKIRIKFLNVQKLPAIPGYKPLRNDNKYFIDNDIAGVTVVCLESRASVSALLAIDTLDESDLDIIQDQKLHSDITHWMHEQLNSTDLIWMDCHNV